MVPKNPRLRFLASRVAWKVYHPGDKVVIWRGQFRGESGFVITAVGKKMHIRLCEPSERIQRFMTGGLVLVFK
jgi:transcription elongation factor